MSLNKVLLIGNVGKDPEIRHLESGASVASFTLATSERYRDRGGELRENTDGTTSSPGASWPTLQPITSRREPRFSWRAPSAPAAGTTRRAQSATPLRLWPTASSCSDAAATIPQLTALPLPQRLLPHRGPLPPTPLPGPSPLIPSPLQ